ncbi:DUF3168 domain-containing protein [Pseudohoeflea coraliihabitans]|uniref:DUF3168 domain-containing protein n=1 Tax=Pseudohoeflea coraliihabitans TaxID=2860393 RepID=A0ABS6WRS2_9HYPH|nr:DUF3168 domain-containing protein [Pseudohoeflea sp. DP4N28-3]MBW3098663.1 DUF3168 domain-containing protein [Pseudohoeflea sp. DP4N28-3]
MSANLLQAAVYQRLAGDAAISALAGAGKVFDGRPLRKTLPYVHLGIWQVEPLSGDDGTFEHRFDIEAWSEQGGQREVAALAEAVRAALHDQPLTLDGATLVNLRHWRSRAGRQAQSRFYRAVVTFRAVVETAA